VGQVEEELSQVCRDIIELLDTNLIPAAADAEPKVVLHKSISAQIRQLVLYTSNNKG